MPRDMSGWTRPVPGSGRVLFPPRFDPTESLISLVRRAAHENDHGTIGHILSTAGYPHHRCFDLSASTPEQLAGLAGVLGLALGDVSSLVIGKVPGGTVASVTFRGAETATHDLSTSLRRVAPRAVVGNGMHRASWQHLLLPWCPHSFEAVIDTCPACGRRLHWYHADEAHRCDARGCGADLTLVAPARLAEERVPAYRRMAALAVPQDFAVAISLHPGLAAVGPGRVFDLGWRMATALDVAAPTSRRDAGRLDRGVIADRLASADELLAGWPTALRDRLADLRRSEGADAARAALKRLRGSFASNACDATLRSAAHAAYPDLMAPGRMALRAIDPTIVNGTGAQKVIGISAERLARIKRAEALEAVARGGSQRGFDDFDVEVVREFAKAKDGSLTAASVSERWGLPLGGVEQLAALAIVEVVSHPALAAAFPGLRVSRDSLDAVTSRLEALATRELSDPYPLRNALKAVGGEKPWGPVFAAMLCGDLAFRIEPGSGRLTQRMSVERTDVALLRTFTFDRSDHPTFDFAADMNLRDAEMAFNVNPGQLPRLLREELGRRFDGGRIRVAEVRRIVTDRIAPAEIYARVEPGRRRMPEFLRRAGLRRVGAAGWRREEVEPLLEDATA